MVPSCLTQASSKAGCLSRPFPVLDLFWLFLNLKMNTESWAAPVECGPNFLIPIGATSGIGYHLPVLRALEDISPKN